MGNILFFMGSSAAGKSTTVKALSNELRSKNYNCVVIDADDLSKCQILPRHGDFSLEARLERGPQLVKIVNWLQPQFDYILIAVTGQPLEVREIFKQSFTNYKSFYLSVSLELRKKRDFKEIYKLKNVPGVDMPYSEPVDCNHTIKADNLTITEIVNIIKKIIL